MLRPGDQIEIQHDDGNVLSLDRELDEIRMLQISRGGEGFSAVIVEREVDIRTVGAHIVIQNSLFEAGVEAGISDAVTMNMASTYRGMSQDERPPGARLLGLACTRCRRGERVKSCQRDRSRANA